MKLKLDCDIVNKLDDSYITELKEKYLSDKIIEILNDEDFCSTIIVFFENDLNISLTSQKAFMHRNTLVYRLNKIQKLTGLDLRNFEDATIFKILICLNKK